MPFIYIVEPEGSSVFKVGMTLKIDSGLSRYLTHCGYFKMTFFDSNSPRSDEAYMHRELLEYHELAEFFSRGEGDCVFNRAMDIAFARLGPPVLRHDEAARRVARRRIGIPDDQPPFDKKVELAAAKPAAVDGGPDGLTEVIQRMLWASDSPLQGDGHAEVDEADWSRYTMTYREAWGVDRIDEPFLRAHGVLPTCPKVAQLIRVLYPSISFEASLDSSLSARRTISRTPLIREVLHALGVASPFDTEHRIPDLMKVWEAGLKDTTFFKAYKDSAAMFYADGKTATWTLNTVSKALGLLFGSVGLKLVSVRKQSRKGGEKTATYSYSLEAESCAEMLELTRLRMRGSAHRAATPNAHARELLLKDEFPRYGHLLSQ